MDDQVQAMAAELLAGSWGRLNPYERTRKANAVDEGPQWPAQRLVEAGTPGGEMAGP